MKTHSNNNSNPIPSNNGTLTTKVKTQLNEINIIDLIKIIASRKRTLFFFSIATIFLSVLYNFLATSIYEAEVTLKKEMLENSGSLNEFKEMFLLQTTDDLNSEIEIIRSRVVLEGIIKELALFFEIEKIKFKDGKVLDINNAPEDYYERINNSEVILPKFSNIDIDLDKLSMSKQFYIEISEPNIFKLYNAADNNLIQTVPINYNSKFNFQGLSFSFDWAGGSLGDKVFFTTKNLELLVRSIKDKIKISRVSDTNIFKVAFQSPSPSYARLIVNTLVEKFRETRLSQKRQTINYSYKFVDKQLDDISEKLKSAEDSLSKFKSENKILNITESSNEYFSFLNNLETKKMETELELNEYRSKVNQINRERRNKGYIDQTYLVPSRQERGTSPFSVLLEQLSNAEINRLELLQKRKENHPDVVAIDDQIAQIKRKLSEFNQNTLNSYQILINSLGKKKRDLDEFIEKYTSKIENLPSQESTIAKLMRNKAIFEKMFNVLLNKREELRMAELSQLQDIIVIDPARIPFEPVSPKKTLNIIISIFLGLVLGTIALFIQEFLDNKVKNPDDLKTLVEAPILGILPKFSEQIQREIKDSEEIEKRFIILRNDNLGIRESYSLLRQKLFSITEKTKNVILVSSGEQSEGKTTIASNLAISMARVGKKVALVDGDLRKAGLTELFSVPLDFPGVINFVTKKENEIPLLWKPFKDVKDKNLNIQILPSGGFSEESEEILNSSKMKNLLKNLQMKFDFVIVDTPPITRTVDLFILGKIVKEVLLIARSKQTLKEHILFAQDELIQLEMNIVGVVLNAYTTKDKQNYIYNYGYYNKESV